MPDLDFKVTGVEGAVHGIVPLLHFKLGGHQHSGNGNNPKRDAANADSDSSNTAHLCGRRKGKVERAFRPAGAVGTNLTGKVVDSFERKHQTIRGQDRCDPIRAPAPTI